MSSITQGRAYKSLAPGRKSHPIAANIKLHRGALLFVNGSGYLDMTTGNGLECLGISPGDQDNIAGAAGAFRAEIECGQSYDFAIGADSDALTDVDVGKDVYAIDNATVGKTNGSNSRAVAGRLTEIRDGRAFVYIAP
jgi:hypothetical protein